MRNPKVLLLAGVLTLFAGVLIWKWVAGWGYVTIDFRDAPLAKVIKAIERQGGVKISTNADQSQLVTLRLDHVTPFEAVDTLAVRVEAESRLAYVAAPQKAEISDVLAAFTSGSNPGGWYVSSGGGGFGGGGGPVGDSEVFLDPRDMDWKVNEMTDKSLQAILAQGSQKTGVLFAVPQTWNPSLTKLPESGKVGKVSANLFKLANGQVQEVFLLTVQPQRPEGSRNTDNGGDDGRRWEFTRTVFSPSRGEGGRRGGGNPEWMAERVQSQINNLPPEEREAAQKDFDDMRKFWASVRDLPEDERRQKIQEMMENPEVQARMEARRDARDAQRSPQQRENRMRNYNQRKQQMKQQTQS